MNKNILTSVSLLNILCFITCCSPAITPKDEAHDIVTYAGFTEIDPYQNAYTRSPQLYRLDDILNEQYFSD